MVRFRRRSFSQHHALRVDRRELRPDSRIRGHDGDRSDRIARRVELDARNEAEGLTIRGTVVTWWKFFGGWELLSEHPSLAEAICVSCSRNSWHLFTVALVATRIDCGLSHRDEGLSANAP